jgi:hypothetical protein
MRLGRINLGETKYVIRAKRKDTDEYVYITALMCYPNPLNATLFNLVEDAEEWFNDNFEVSMMRKINKVLDTDTLEIVEINLKEKSAKKLDYHQSLSFFERSTK